MPWDDLDRVANVGKPEIEGSRKGAQPVILSFLNVGYIMSYLVLARKYRPMFFEDVVGQEHATLTLQHAIEQNRTASAYLFSGPRGVGKTTVARLLAKALNCEQGPTTKPCNQCSFCKEINESRSLDVFEIDGASNRGIDEVRNLREGLRYTSSPGKYRIYIIDEVHMLTNEAFNALLKTLEEPPKNVLFIFATTEPHKVPATILSRCQRFDFKRLSNKNIIRQLEIIAQRENLRIETEALRLIAVKADGGMRDAQSLLDQMIAYAGENIQLKHVAELLGIIDRDLFFRVTDMIKTNDVKGVLELAAHIFVEGYDYNEFLLGLSDHFRCLLVSLTTGQTDELDVSEEDGRRYLKICTDFQVEDLLRFIKIASDTEGIIRKSSNGRFHLEVALVKMVKMSSSTQLSELLQALKKKSNPAPTGNPGPEPLKAGRTTLYDPEKANRLLIPDPQKQPESHEDQPTNSNCTVEQIEDNWRQILEEVKKRKIALGMFLSEGWPVCVENNRLEIMFAPEKHFQMSSISSGKELIQQIIYEKTGAHLAVYCSTDTNNELEKKRKFNVNVDKKSEFEKLVKENSTVQRIVQLFDTELVQ